ncbi:hypothetical protein UPYG_G00295600 [Umbra pygmaea]|uniref:Chemokine interleukin-8-like domain-containing protein n=1 Tax=Umbra pygmaea TaxID=75934 RepID=A0ABD0W605_UMBPY
MTCCKSYSSGRLTIDRICGYSIQTITGPCNINAIIFHSVKGKHICVDPKQVWVMATVRKLREKAERLNKKRTHSIVFN